MTIHFSNLARSSVGEPDCFWIGLKGSSTEGNWVWNSGKEASFTNWRSGRPNGGTKENCAWMNIKYDGEWYDYPCDIVTSYICEIPL